MNILSHTSKLLNKYGITAGFTERTGGVSPQPFSSLNMKRSNLVGDTVDNVSENMLRALHLLKISKGATLQLEGQSNVWVAKSDSKGLTTIYEHDAATTKRKDYALMITVADCFPVLIADDNGMIGIAHCGWKGLAQGIIVKTVEEMVAHGAQEGSLVAAIGPGICGKCYEVGKEVADQFTDEFVDTTGSKYYVDLLAAIKSQLQSLDINEIDDMSICTYENTDKYYSARKEKTTGRFLAYILRPSA